MMADQALKNSAMMDLLRKMMAEVVEFAQFVCAA